jgi:hypothetical protein
MKRVMRGASRLLAAGIVAGCCGTALAQPANDTCGSDRPASTIPPIGGSVSGDLTGATRDGSACAGTTGVDVYYYWTPSFTGGVTIATCGNASFDTVVSLHADACPVGSSIACNDDGCGLQSTINPSVTAGTPYIIRMASFGATTGAFTLTVTPLVLPTNDECGPTNPLVTVDVPVVGGNQLATTSLTIDPPTTCGPAPLAGGENDLFYRFVPPTSGPYTFSLCGSSFDTVLSVHTDCPVTSANVVGCNDDSTATVPCSGTFSLQSFLPSLALTGGTTYYVRVAGYGTGRGSFTLTVTSGGPASGACCDPDGTCAVGVGQTCTSPSVFLGDGTTCGAPACPATGSCCNAVTGACSVTFQAGCTETWTSGAVCEPNPCPQPPPPANDACSATAPVLTLGVPTPGSNIFATTDGASSCPGSGSGSDVYFRFTAPTADTYTFTTCSGTVGLDSVLTIHSSCPADASTELGCNDDDFDCPSSGVHSTVVLGLSAGQEVIVRVAGYAGFIPTGDQDAFVLTVTTGGVAPISGACCSVNNTCALSTSAACVGTYQGDGSTCSPNPCSAPTGACCLPSGTCTVTTQLGCAGTYQGDGSGCTPNPCPQAIGACCAASGACSIQTVTACQAAGGTFRGLGTDCNPNLCPQPTGVCCRGATCAGGVPQAQCVGVATSYSNLSATCNSAGNTSSPCCHADFDKNGIVNTQDIFDFLAAFFQANPIADMTGNGAGTPQVQSVFDFLAAWFTPC